MQKVRLKILKDHEAAPDGIKLVKYNAGEVLELGTPRLTGHLYQFYSRNPNYAELLIEEKQIENAPENKMVKNLENKSFLSFSKNEPEETDLKEKNNFKNNSKKRK